MKKPHAAIAKVLDAPEDQPSFNQGERWDFSTTSASLAKVLAIGCLSGLPANKTSLNIWDPAAGTGFAGHLLVDALTSSGVSVSYRGQEVNVNAAKLCKERFKDRENADVVLGDTLSSDLHPDFEADLVIVDAPWGMSWKNQEASVKQRHTNGEFKFGLPRAMDSTWLFLSLALEKLKSPEDGGGRVAALVTPATLSSIGADSRIREQIIEHDLLESVTRLPYGLAPNTQITLYLLVLSNVKPKGRIGKAQIADLQTEFSALDRKRILKKSALLELESGLRTWRPGPRNRTITFDQFNRFEARVQKPVDQSLPLSWTITTFNNTPIDADFLSARYGENHSISLQDDIKRVVDFDPSRIFKDQSKDLIQSINQSGYPAQRLSNLLTKTPTVLNPDDHIKREDELFIPTSPKEPVSTELDIPGRPRKVAVTLNEQVLPGFLCVWLNSDLGYASRNRALDAASSGHHHQMLRTDERAFLKWADELLIPVPDLKTQTRIMTLNNKLESYRVELESLRATIWSQTEEAEGAIAAMEGAFDQSLESWIEDLPHPIASVLWTAHTAASPGDMKTAYIHAWEAIVTFHANVLLSAIRSDEETSQEIETSIRETLSTQGLSMERTSFGNWVIIFETIAKRIREVLAQQEPDAISKIRKSFADLSTRGIERLVSTDVVKLFNQLNATRNRWHGHSGFATEEEKVAQVEILVSHLRELRQYLGNVWTQLTLVQPKEGIKKRSHFEQVASRAMGTRAPFTTEKFTVGELMEDGELYLVMNGSEKPLRLASFVQLRAAPTSAHTTSYFYNRTDGNDVHMVSYQYSTEAELTDSVGNFKDDFGALI